MQTNILEPTSVEKNFFVDSVPAQNRGKAFSISDIYGSAKKAYIGDSMVHDANFAFLSTTLAKLHEQLYEPKWFVTYALDIPLNVGGGFVDYVSYFTVDWSGIMNEFRNVMGNNANFIPRINAGLSQKKVNVYTFEVAYDLRFVELEKMKKLTLQKSIQEIYSNIIVAGWDLFAQKVAYTGMHGSHGLYNSPNVLVTMIDNSTATDPEKGFVGMDDSSIVSFFNGLFELVLDETNMNLPLLFDTILVPTFVGSDLSSRYSVLYTSTLRKFISTHNLAVDESALDNFKVTIASRPGLNTAGVNGKGRIVAYKKDPSFLRLDVPYPIQQYITLPNIERMAYTTAFVGQVSEIQMPYNDGANGGTSGDFGPITYWDFTGEVGAGTSAASATSVISESANAITVATTYANVAELSDDYVVDAIIESSELMPEGTKLAITGLGGDPAYYQLGVAKKRLWLSDIIKGQNEAANTRAKLNIHTGGDATQTFVITVSGLANDLVTNMTLKVVTSNQLGLEGTWESKTKMVAPITLVEVSKAIALDADE